MSSVTATKTTMSAWSRNLSGCLMPRSAQFIHDKMPRKNHLKKLFLEMGIIVLIAVSIGLVVNRRMLFDIRNRDTSTREASPSTVSPARTTPAGLPQVRELYESDQAVFVDARVASAFATEHIRKAVSLPLGDFDRVLPSFREKYGPASILVAYCSGYGCHDSGLLAEKLLRAGYGKVLVFEGGLPEWKAAGLPVEGNRK